MDVQEITKRLYAIGNALMEKTGESPWITPSLSIKDDKCIITLYAGCNGGDYAPFGTAKGETPEAALDDADRIIAALPSHEKVKLHRHMARIADCIDKAHADGIGDEYVTPLRMTVKAMSDNLLGVDQ